MHLLPLWAFKLYPYLELWNSKQFSTGSAQSQSIFVAVQKSYYYIDGGLSAYRIKTNDTG